MIAVAAGPADGGEAELLQRMAPVLDAAPAGPLGVAVSGGGDSVALLLLMDCWRRATGRGLAVATVDHGLRPESAAEAAEVAALAARLGLCHDTLRWRRTGEGGNLQDRARQARRALLAEWARGRGIGAVALGHTLDDQAETVLLRLARGSGVDGLAAMAPVSEGAGVVWLRPLLAVRRDGLRDYLAARGEGWAEDPSNEDQRFDRVRLRRLMPELAALGLTAERLAGTAERMGTARAALSAAVLDAARRIARPSELGEVYLDPAGLAALPDELRHRLLAASLMWVAREAYRPRLAMLAELDADVAAGLSGGGRTLHGCVIRAEGGALAIRREPARVEGERPAGGLWDRRWVTPAEPGLTVRALGADGLAALPGWRALGLPREALLTTPALCRDGRIVGHARLMPEDGPKPVLDGGAEGFFAAFIRR